MQFTVNSAALVAALSAAARVTPKKVAMPVLENIKLEIPGQQCLDITATDGETTLVQRIPISTNDTAYVTSVCLTPKTILGPLQTIHNQDLTIEIDGLEVVVKYNSGQFNLVGIKSEEFPEHNKLDPEKSSIVDIASQSLTTAINRTIFATAEDELRPVMCGIFFDFNNTDKLTCVASDSKKLVRAHLPSAWKGTPTEKSVIMPRKMAALIKSVMTKECGDCELRWDSNQIAIKFGKSLLATKRIEGKFPRYEAVIPKNNNLEAIIDSRSLQTTLKRMLSFANADTEQVVLDIKDNACTISSRDNNFNKSAQETVTCNYSDAPIRISFRASIMIDVLSNLPSGDIRLAMSEATRPALVSPLSTDNDSDILSLIMPMAIVD